MFNSVILSPPISLNSLLLTLFLYFSPSLYVFNFPPSHSLPTPSPFPLCVPSLPLTLSLYILPLAFPCLFIHSTSLPLTLFLPSLNLSLPLSLFLPSPSLCVLTFICLSHSLLLSAFFP